ncbi:type II toxin-antitoxin system prevent-host-death family antitoxin [uncultured Pseudomonas sp.]|uniref:type II toxin-antitoxin system Phd/YefM family antitoxin n=1 Tax=uncultured Pseudomonas sp. TaxID=114707 RepID=UPI0025927B41|nr:type II toxin-antitoxin system prevent-host-death family antitoxin [uncultured Pseudomonas sp.]
MYYIDYAELEANFEQCVERANNGEEVVTTCNGKPLVKLVALQPVLPSIGTLKGQYTFDASASNAMDKESEDLFYAGEIFTEGRSAAGPGPTKSGGSENDGQ